MGYKPNQKSGLTLLIPCKSLVLYLTYEPSDEPPSTTQSYWTFAKPCFARRHPGKRLDATPEAMEVTRMTWAAQRVMSVDIAAVSLIYIYVYIYMYTCRYIHIHIHIYIYIYTYTHIHIHTYTHTHIYIYIVEDMMICECAYILI